MGYSITEIEDAIIAELRASTMGSYCTKIDTFQLEGADVEEQIRLFAKSLPCALVVYKGADYKNLQAVSDRVMTFSILVAAQSLRGRGAARRGTVGSYQMLDDLRKTLSTKTLSLNIDPLLPEKEEAEVNSELFSAYSLSFRTKARYTYGT